MTELAAVTDPEGMCPVCRSGEAIRQTSCTPLVEAFSCDRCDTRWAITVVNPEPELVDRIATAMAARSTADEVITVAPGSPRPPGVDQSTGVRDLGSADANASAGRRAQVGQDDDNQPRGYYIGACGHPVPLVGPICYVGPCEECGVGR